MDNSLQGTTSWHITTNSAVERTSACFAVRQPSKSFERARSGSARNVRRMMNPRVMRLLVVVLIIPCTPDEVRQLPPAAKHASTTVTPATGGPIYNDVLPVDFVAHAISHQVTLPSLLGVSNRSFHSQKRHSLRGKCFAPEVQNSTALFLKP